MKKQLLFAIALTCFLASIALADEGQQQGQWNRHQGFFSEFNLGSNLLYYGVLSSAGNASNGGFHGYGWSVAGGYYFSPKHAIEGGFMQSYNKYEDDGDEEENTRADVTYLAWRGKIPIRDRFAFFGKIGAMLVSIPDTDESSWVVLPFTGIGCSYAITPNVEFCLQYQGAIYVIVGYGSVTAGITYHF